MGVERKDSKPMTDRLRQEIINQYRRSQNVEVISRRLNIDKNRVVSVIIDYIIDVVDAMQKEGE